MPLDTLLPDPEADTQELVVPKRRTLNAPAPRARQRTWNLSPDAMSQLDEMANMAAPAASATPAAAKPEKPLGLMGTIREGAKGTLRMLGATADTMQGDAQGVVQAAQEQAAAPKDPDLEKFYSHIEERKKALGENPSLWEGIKAVGSAAIDNPRGFGLMVAEQLPNSAAALGAGGAGALAGSVAGPVGTVVGGLAGLGLANIGLETGSKALEAAQDNAFTPEEQSRVRREGLVKGGVITGVDAATLGVTKFITGTTRRAVERATTKTLIDNGIDVTNAAARKAALETPEIAEAVKSAQELAKQGADKLGKRLARTGGAAALETIGEGAGEYLGELAATGKANAVDAVVEGFAGLGTSIGEIAATGAMNRKGLQRLFDNPETAEKTAEEETKKTGVPHEAIKSPTEPDKFVAVPKTRSVGGIELERDAEGNLKPVAPKSTQEDFNLANRPGFEHSAEDKAREHEIIKAREDAYAKNPIITPASTSTPKQTPTIAGRPVTDLTNNALIYTVNRGSARAKEVASAEIERRKTEVSPANATGVEHPATTLQQIVAVGAEKAQEDAKKAKAIPTPTPAPVKPDTAPKSKPIPAPKAAKVAPAPKPTPIPKLEVIKNANVAKDAKAAPQPAQQENAAVPEVKLNPADTINPQNTKTEGKPVVNTEPKITVSEKSQRQAEELQKTLKNATKESRPGEKIQDAIHKIKGRKTGQWYPITVNHNGITQHFLANQKKAGWGTTLLHIKDSHLANGLEGTHAATTYKLAKDNDLQKIRATQKASDKEIEAWKKAGLPINPKNPAQENKQEGTDGAAPKTHTAKPSTGADSAPIQAENTPNSAHDIRPHIDALIKRRAAARQINKERTFDKALAAAKAMLAGETVPPAKFKNAANLLKGDKATADILTTLQAKAEEAKKAAKMAPKPAFSRSAAPAKAQPPLSVEATIKHILSRWKNAPEVVVLNSLDDAPAEVKAENERQLSMDATGEPEGFIADNKVYLIASQLKTPGDAIRVLMHESLGHFGLNGVFGDELLNQILKEVAALRRKDVEGKAIQYGLDMSKEEDRLTAAEEVLAEMAQRNPKSSLVQRTIAAIHQWLRAHVPGFKNLKLSDSEIIENFLVPARQFVINGKPNSLEFGGIKTRFSRSASPTSTAIRSRIDKAIDSLIYNFQDRFKPLKDIQERSGPVAEDEDAALAEERYSGMVRARTDAFTEELRDPLLKAIHESGVAYEDVEEYLHALHAPSRNAAMKEINPTEAELKAKTSALEKQRDTLAKDPDVSQWLKLRRELRQAEADIEDGIADESLARAINSDIARLRSMPNVKDYADALDKLKALRLVKPFQGDNTALSGMSDAKAKAVLDKIDGNGTRKALERVSAMVDAITSKTRQIYIDSGLEKANVIESWNKNYEHYVPLHRDEVSGNTMPRIGQGFNIKGKESKRATGSNKEVTNILAHVVAQHEAAIIRSEKSKVDRALFQFAQRNPDPSLWTLDDAPMLRTVDPNSGLVVERVDPTYKNRPEVLTLKIDGEEHTITFNTQNEEAMRLVTSMKNLSSEQMGEVTAMVGKMTRWLATMNTTMNPVFTARNFLRDLQTTYVNLSDTAIADKKREVFRDIGPAIRGMWAMSRGDKKSKWAKYAQEFKAAGGQTGWMDHYKDIGARADNLKKELETLKPGKMNLARRTLNGWWDIVQDANNAVENGARLSAYVNARKSGLSEGKAAQLAKNLTVNFNAHGAKGVELNSWYMFMNASIQGSARLFKALSNKQVRHIVAGVILSGFLMDILARSMAGDDDDDGENDYDQLPEHVKAMNFVFMVNNRPVTIPMPYGYNFFASAGRKVSEMMFRPHYSAVKSAADLTGVFIDAFSPTGQAGSFLQYLSPTVTDPLVQWSENRNFAGNPLRRPQSPFGVPNPEYQMGFKSTSAPAKWLAEMLNNETGGNEVRPGYVNVNPAFFDFAVSSIAGGAGRTYLQTLSAPMKIAKDEELKAKEIPFVNIFIGAKPEYQTEKKYFDAVRSVETAKDELKTYRLKGDTEMVKEILQDHPEVRLAAAAKETKNLLARLRKRELKIDETQPENKAELRRAIEDQKREAMAAFNKKYRIATTAE